jgi:hypothetical protein
MRRAILVTAAVLAAVFVFIAATLPPAPSGTTGQIDETVKRATIAGAFHVHSTRSDGTGDRDAIAAAAASAGLQFVVITDHGDATRQPDAPVYVRGVLCIDAVEISTNGGHYIALNMPAAPYPLGGEAFTVVEDVARLGGFGIAAHPDSPKRELAWTDRDSPIDGFEWLNLDSEWRDESRSRLVRAALAYPFRSPAAVTAVLDRPASLDRWDALSAVRRVAGFAAHDAHGGWARGSEDGGRPGMPGVPSYEASFRAFAIRAILDAAPTGIADRDAAMLMKALRGGRVFTAIDGVAGPAWVDFRAASSGANARVGEDLAFAADVRLIFRSTIPAGARAVLLRGGKEVLASTSGELNAAAQEPGVYRVEVSAPGAPGEPPVPWIVTNPIYLSAPSSPNAIAPTEATRQVAVDGVGAVEKDPGSSATLSEAQGRRRVEFQLKSGDRVSQYVALAVPLTSVPAQVNAVAFTVRAEAAMRLSVQLRFDSAGGARWGRSVYVSRDPVRIIVPVKRLLPADARRDMPGASAATSALFVVDLTNAAPGLRGQFEVSDLALLALENADSPVQVTGVPKSDRPVR